MNVLKNSSGKLLLDGGKPMQIPNCKVFTFSSASAVANQNIKVVSADPMVARHYSDDTAYCIIRKLGAITGNGIVLAVNSNKESPYISGVYSNYNGTANNSANVSYPMKNTPLSTTVGVINATSNGDIYIRCANLQNNFGGATYEIIFTW